MAPTRKLPKPLTLNREAALSTDLVVEMVRSACLKRSIAVQLLVWSGRFRVSIQLLQVRIRHSSHLGCDLEVL